MSLIPGIDGDVGPEAAEVTGVDLEEVELGLRHPAHAHAGGQVNLDKCSGVYKDPYNLIFCPTPIFFKF